MFAISLGQVGAQSVRAELPRVLGGIQRAIERDGSAHGRPGIFVLLRTHVRMREGFVRFCGGEAGRRSWLVEDGDDTFHEGNSLVCLVERDDGERAEHEQDFRGRGVLLAAEFKLPL